MSSFKIEKGIPPPENYTRFPLGEMAVGDSFFVPAHRERAAIAAVSQYGRRHTAKFVTRKEGDGRRVWRVK